MNTTELSSTLRLLTTGVILWNTITLFDITGLVTQSLGNKCISKTHIPSYGTLVRHNCLLIYWSTGRHADIQVCLDILAIKLVQIPSVLWHCWLGVMKSIRPAKNWVMGTVVVICLECGADDLHMVQLMPLLPSSPASVKSRMVYLSGAGLPRLSWKKGR